MNQWHNTLSPTISLDGEWQFSLGDKIGSIQVPGTWEAQGYPRDIDGPAIYQRMIRVPADWDGHTVQLQFDALSYFVEIKVNGAEIGKHTGLWTPFAFDITDAVQAGIDNDIHLTVYKPGTHFPIRESLAGFLPDVCLPFGGLWQSARLVAFPSAAISHVHVQAQTNTGSVRLKAQLHDAMGMVANITITDSNNVQVDSWRTIVTDADLTAEFTIDPVQEWSIHNLALYQATIRLEEAHGNIAAEVTSTFGFRSLSRQDDQLLLNNEPIFLRGVLNWGWYPEILCPAPDEATIREEFRRIRAFGYNMVKLCLYVPSPLYFDIADEEGMLLWLELPMWLPEVSERLRQQAPHEYADILAAVHHHPSIVIYSLGCELGAAVDSDLLSKLNAILRAQTADVLVCDNSGSGEAYGGLAFDYADFNDYHFYADLHYFNPLLDHFRRDWRPARPWIFGEFCDADDYRDTNKIAAAHNGELPWWLVEQNPIHKLTAIAYSQQPLRMAALDIPFDGQALQHLSRQQSFVVRKAILEKVRAKSSMGGYVVTSIRETPLATSSMFDDLGRDKYDREAFRQFNADSVLVLEQGRARLWNHGGDRPAPVDRNNHVAGMPMDFRIVLSQAVTNLTAGNMNWQLLDTNRNVFQSGTAAYPARQAQHTPSEIASIYLTAPEMVKAQQLILEVQLEGGIKNSWSLWVYPAVEKWATSFATYDPSGALRGLDDLADTPQQLNNLLDIKVPILITSVFTPEVYEYVKDGGCVIVLQKRDGSLPVKPVPFWRESIKMLYEHPILANFPHQNYADLQFYHLATDYAVDTDRLLQLLGDIQQVKPIIRRLDARQFTLLDYLVEYKIGSGTLLASTLRFDGGAGDQVDGLKNNIAGRHLLTLMMKYLESP